MELNILYEDKDILVCEKLPGVPVQSDKTLALDLVNQLKNYLFEKGETTPYIGLVHRLDRPVGGIMVFGKTKQATRNLSQQVQQRQMEKTYLCIVTKELPELLEADKMLLTDFLKKDGRTNTSKIVSATDKTGKKAQLYYKVIKVADGCSLVEVELLTGRHHQIRVQMAAHVAGILGDTKYNVQTEKNGRGKGIALYSNSLTIMHPKTGKRLTFSKKPQGEYWEKYV